MDPRNMLSTKGLISRQQLMRNSISNVIDSGRDNFNETSEPVFSFVSWNADAIPAIAIAISTA